MQAVMRPGMAKTAAAKGLVEAALCGELTEKQAQRLYRLGPEAVTLALMATSKRIAELQGASPAQPPSPSTPSGMVPIYTKPNTPK